MKTPVFTGSAAALVTPFRWDKIDYEKLGELVDYHIANGTDALVVCATTGESCTQTAEEHLIAIDYAVQRAAGRIKIIGSTGSNDTLHAVKMSQAAASYGVDGLLMVTPYYNKTTQRGLVKHYQYIADRVDKPIILYNVPSRTGLGFTAESYAELSKHPNINGAKESSGNMGLISTTLAMCEEGEFNFWSGNDDETVPIMSMGGKGVISVLTNIMPKEMKKLTDLCLAGNFAEAAKLQVSLTKLMNALFIEVNPIPVKTAMNLMGFDVGDLRLPLYEMSDKNLEILRDAMREQGLIK